MEKELASLIGEIEKELSSGERLKLAQEGALVAIVGNPTWANPALLMPLGMG